jgi:hypothetical protein
MPLRKSLTYDQGKEMSQHKTLAADLGLKVFFCHPHSSWERGTCKSQNVESVTPCPKALTSPKSLTSNSVPIRKYSMSVLARSSDGNLPLNFSINLHQKLIQTDP